MPPSHVIALAATLAACLSLSAASDSPLHYPAPPNPFATPKPPLPEPDLPLPPPPRLDGSLPTPLPPKETQKPRRSGFRLRWQPVVCMGVLSAVCVKSRPQEQQLLVAIDEYHKGAAGLLDLGLRGEPTNFRDLGLVSVGLHSNLVWLGILGSWLPLLPTTQEAIAHWLPAATAPQLLFLALTFGYLIRKILPRSFVEHNLSISFSNLLKLRIWTVVTAAFSPVGLVHWLHAVVVLLAVMPSLSASLSRPEQLLLYTAAGAAASACAALGGLIFRRGSNPRASVSGAVMGVLLMRAAMAPEEAIAVAGWEIPVLRAALIHFVLDNFSNATPEGGGVEKLLGLVGAAAVVATKRPQLRELVQEGGWQRVLDYLQSAL